MQSPDGKILKIASAQEKRPDSLGHNNVIVQKVKIRGLRGLI